MATVTRKFRDDFEAWAADRVARGMFSGAEMEAFRETLRQDLAPGPDRFRAGLTVTLADGVEVSAAIDDHQERYRFWAEFFGAEAGAIRKQHSAPQPRQ